MNGVYLRLVAEQLGISLFLLAGVLIWSAVWKILALWKAARNKSLVWFIVLALVNTLGILEILYLFVFSECCKKTTKQKARRKRKR
jgi:hypothetical protein